MDEALMKRVLPHSVEAEQSVIGSMLMDKDAIIAASEIITAADFYQQSYGIMFEAMVELFNEGAPVDLITLQNRLKEKDVPPEVERIVKAADKLSAYIKCVEELKAGNLEFKKAAEQTRRALDEMKMPELDYFMEHCMESFSMTLDELE